MFPEIAIALLLSAQSGAPAAGSGSEASAQKDPSPAQKAAPSKQGSLAQPAEAGELDLELLQLLDMLEQWDLFMNYTFFEGEKP